MAESSYSRKLKARLANFIDERAHSLARGEAFTYDIYRQQVGFIEGLAAAIEAANELDKELD